MSNESIFERLTSHLARQGLPMSGTAAVSWGGVRWVVVQYDCDRGWLSYRRTYDQHGGDLRTVPLVNFSKVRRTSPRPELADDLERMLVARWVALPPPE